MDTLTADPRGADGHAQDAPRNGAGAPDAQTPTEAQPQPQEQGASTGPEGASANAAARACSSCGAPLAAGQDWCLQCGTGVGAGIGTPGWRSTVALVAAAAVLVLAAGGVGYAALSKGPRRAAVITRTVAQVAPPAATAPPAAVTPTPPPAPKVSVPATPSIATTPVVPASKPPASSTPASTPSTTSTGSSTTPAGSGSEEPPPGEAIVLDTNASSTYNPSTLPAASFGDPTLAIDGDPATGWTALVEPAAAPKLTAGLEIDLKSPQRVAAVELITSTPGMTVQIYGSTAGTAPASITDPAWKKLTRATVVHKRHVKLTLRESAHGVRFIVLWISRAPSASVGTPQKPGHVSVNELELFPPHH